MRSIGPWIAAVALLAAPRYPASAADGAAPGGATPSVRTSAVHVLAPGYTFEAVVPSRARPGGYGLVFGAERPTPGYRVQPESVRVDPEAKTIVARVVEIPPEGMVAQVITRSTFSVDLPELSPGTYAFRLEKRRERDAAFTPAVALTLTVGRSAS